jgi:nucleoside-diphosphate-sugar epimerase
VATEILVTGASGFVGRHLVPALEALGYAVRRLSRADGDIARSELPFENIAHVFHLAGKVFVPESWSDPRSFYEVNVLGTANVLEFCRRRGASVTLLSSYVYGRPQHLPIAEHHPLDPFNPYCHTKILAEEVGRFYEKAFRVPVTIVRPFNLYGAGQDERFLIPSLVRQAIAPEGEAIKLGDLRPKRDYLWIGDLVELLVVAFRQGARGTYNAGTGYSVSVEEMAQMVLRAAGTGKRLAASGEERPQEVMDVVADIGKARSELGWEPRTGLEEGIRRLVQETRRGTA